MRLTLREAAPGASFKWITQGRQRIGRVVRMGDGSGFLGIIGKESLTRPTEAAAFDEIAARHLGYPSADALRLANQRMRRARRVLGAAGDYLASEMLRGNFEPLDKVMRAPEPVGSTLFGVALKAATRKILNTTPKRKTRS